MIPELSHQSIERLLLLICVLLTFSSILYRFDVISAFLIAESGGKTISAARARACYIASEVAVRFLDPDLV
jgi:hypothetical protein